MEEEDDIKFAEAINRLTRDTKNWLRIKKILEDEIASNTDLIAFIDKIIKEKEKKLSEKN